jgi:hypothetical protein
MVSFAPHTDYEWHYSRLYPAPLFFRVAYWKTFPSFANVAMFEQTLDFGSFIRDSENILRIASPLLLVTNHTDCID